MDCRFRDKYYDDSERGYSDRHFAGLRALPVHELRPGDHSERRFSSSHPFSYLDRDPYGFFEQPFCSHRVLGMPAP